MKEKWYRVVIKTTDLPDIWLICAPNREEAKIRALANFSTSTRASFVRVVGVDVTLDKQKGGIIMKTLCYYLDRTPEVDKIITYIAECIPCWISIESVEMDMREVTFRVRQEDASAVQTALAPYL